MALPEAGYYHTGLAGDLSIVIAALLRGDLIVHRSSACPIILQIHREIKNVHPHAQTVSIIKQIIILGINIY